MRSTEEASKKPFTILYPAETRKLMLTPPALVGLIDAQHTTAVTSLFLTRRAWDVSLPRRRGSYLISGTFLFYDHLLTLHAEVAFIWPHARSASARWFFLNRYVNTLSNVGYLVWGFMDPSKQNCRALATYRTWMAVVTQMITVFALLVRTYALYGKSRRILALLLGIAALLFAIGLTGVVLTVKDPFMVVLSEGGCHIATSARMARFATIPWIALCLFDLLIFALTLNRTRQLSRTVRAPSRDLSQTVDSKERGVDLRADVERLRRLGAYGRGRAYLVWILTRDGAIYFGVMALSNLLNILTYFLSPPILKGVLNAFATTISVTMISHLMLNLHASVQDASLAAAPGTAVESDIASSMYPDAGERPFTSLFETGPEGMVVTRMADEEEYELQLQFKSSKS